MQYKTGETVEIGDSVAIEYGKTVGTVEAIIETPEQIAEWKLDWPGIMIAAKPFGLVFWPDDEPYDPVVFLARKYT